MMFGGASAARSKPGTARERSERTAMMEVFLSGKILKIRRESATLVEMFFVQFPQMPYLIRILRGEILFFTGILSEVVKEPLERRIPVTFSGVTGTPDELPFALTNSPVGLWALSHLPVQVPPLVG